MTSVTFGPSVGGDGTVITDDASPTTGLKQGGHRTRFVKALEQTVAVAQKAVDKAAEANTYASSALLAPGTSATCVNSIAIPTVFPTDVSFTLAQIDKLFTKGQTLLFADSVDPEKQFLGVLTAFTPSTGAGTIKVRQSSGTGTLNNWNVSLSTPLDATLTGRVTALETNAAAEAEDRLFYYGDMS